MLRYKTETRPGLVASYNIRPVNGARQFLQPRSPHGAQGHGITEGEYLKNGACWGQSFYRTLIGNHTRCKRVARVCQHQLSFLFHLHCRRSWIPCTNTNLVFIWCVPVTSSRWRRRRQVAVYVHSVSRRRSSLRWQRIRMTRSANFSTSQSHTAQQSSAHVNHTFSRIMW